MKRLEKCFVTGCDSSKFWQLGWFLKNFRRHSKEPIVFADFGLTQDQFDWARENFDDIIPRDRLPMLGNTKNWWLKPYAIIQTNSDKKIWVDTDCEILSGPDTIFDILVRNKISLVVDRPWTKRRGELWYNTGVVGIFGNPPLLDDWANKCRILAFTSNPNIGDQDALHFLLNDDPINSLHIHTIVNLCNWLRLQLLDGEDDDEKIIMHWTGFKGDDIIREKIRNG